MEGTAVPENVRRFGNGIVVPENSPHQLAAALVKTLTEPPPPAETQIAREKVVAFMRPEKVAELHVAAYRAVLKS